MAFIVRLENGHLKSYDPFYPGGMTHPSQPAPGNLKGNMRFHDTMWNGVEDGMQYANVKFGVPNDNMTNLVADADWTLMRYEEMILVQAEGLARSGKEAEAKALLEGWVKANRNPEYTCVGDIVDAIWMQRRIELWGEGFSWFDLNRLEKPIIRTTSTNWPAAWIVDVPADHDCRIWTLPDREIQNNDGISEADNNPVGDPFK
jgi:hypothetical protein